MVKDYLPIGSIVKMKGSKQKVMVTGLQSIRATEPNRVYDYIGVIYPMGYLSSAYQVLFDNEEIEETVFVGYSDELRDRYIELLSEASER